MGRAIVALPLISRSEWQSRGFDKLVCCPPIIFSDDLRKSTMINIITLVDKWMKHFTNGELGYKCNNRTKLL